MEKTIIIKGYPTDLTFKIEELSSDSLGMRTKIFVEYLERNKIKYKSYHVPSDFVVENFDSVGKDVEIWEIGS